MGLARKKMPQRFLAALGILALVIASGLVGSAPAAAINRSNFCFSNDDKYYSDATTCWTGTGGVSVGLYNNYGHHSGIWGGCYTGIFYDASGWVRYAAAYQFVSGVDFTYGASHMTVQYIYHSSNGGGSAICLA